MVVDLSSGRSAGTPEAGGRARGRGLLQFIRVTKRFADGQTGLDEVTFAIESGEFVFLTGDSGAGKTTLLSLVYRATLPTSGTVLVNGRNVGSLPAKKVPYLRRSIGVVFQDSRLIRRKTVYENVSYLPRILGLERRAPEGAGHEGARSGGSR